MTAHFAMLMWLINRQRGSDIDFEWLPLDTDEGADV